MGDYNAGRGHTEREGNVRLRALIVLALAAGACNAADSRVDPADLELRDLLGVAPETAQRWDQGERARAAEVIHGALREVADPEVVPGAVDDTVPAALRVLGQYDRARAQRDADAAAVVRAEAADTGTSMTPIPMALPAEGVPQLAIAPVGFDGSLEEIYRGRAALLTAIAMAAGHPDDTTLEVRPARRATFAAAYLPGSNQLLINPIWLLVTEPDAGEPAGAFAAPVSLIVDPAPVMVEPAADRVLAAGNPYSFFGSVGECAAAQRLRCETCLPSSSCIQESRDALDGNDECTQLGAEDGLGYFLFCANLSLAIATVADCALDAAPQCGGVVTASNQLAALDANRAYVEDMTCRSALDTCLTRIYGEPSNDYPVPTDAGPGPTPPPPRDTSPGCGGSDVNCDFSPQCDNSCSDPDCGQSIQCNNTCSNDTSCQGCGSDDGGGGGGCGSSEGSGGGGCGSDDSSGSGGGCGGSDSGSDSGGGCGGSDSSGGSSCDNSCGGSDSGGGGGCGGDGCGGGSDSGGGGCGGGDSGGSCGGGDGGGSCGGGGGSGGGSCEVTTRRAPRVHGLVLVSVTVVWALLPLPLLELLRRRERRRRSPAPKRKRADQPGGDA